MCRSNWYFGICLFAVSFVGGQLLHSVLTCSCLASSIFMISVSRQWTHIIRKQSIESSIPLYTFRSQLNKWHTGITLKNSTHLYQTINQLRICAITTLVFLTTLLSDLLWWSHPPALKAFKEDRSTIHFYFFCHVLRKSYNMVSSHGKDWMSTIKRTLQNNIYITNKSICLNSGNNKTPWY